MASLSAIVITDDEESGLKQGRSQPPKGFSAWLQLPRLGRYNEWCSSFRWCNWCGNTPCTQMQKTANRGFRWLCDESQYTTQPKVYYINFCMSLWHDLLLWLTIWQKDAQKLQKTLEHKFQEQQRTLIDSYRTIAKLQEELRQERKGHQKTKEQLQTKKGVLECTICYGHPDHWVVLSCGHLFCKTCNDRPRNLDKACPICRRYITGHMDCIPYAGWMVSFLFKCIYVYKVQCYCKTTLGKFMY